VIVVLVWAGIAYLIVAFVAIVRFWSRRLPAPNHRHGVTILKPVHGLEIELEENLRSFCMQKHPQCQVIFGVQRADDPAIPIVERVISSVPNRDCMLVVDESPVTGNPKMSNVASMLAHAKYDMLAISDADMRVDERYAGIIAASLDDARVGAVTCPYLGAARGGFDSRLAALHIDDHFMPSVFVATLFGPPRFCFGSTMAVRRQVLDEIGGIEALKEHLADDYALGRLVSERGYRVELSRYIVTNVVHEPNTHALLTHEVRWARTIRMVQPLGYVFSFVTYPVALALMCGVLAMIGLSPGLPVVIALIVAYTARGLVHLAVQILLKDDFRLSKEALVPISDVFEFVVWACGLFGSSVVWQDRTLSTRDRDLL
jgi:ceramide glucosyltransferase